MMRRVLGLCWVVLVGCSGKSEEEVYEPPQIPPPPPKEVRLHEPTGAILSKPEPSWQWLEGDAVKALAPDAVLGLRRDEHCEGWVAVTDTAERSPRRAATVVLEARKASGAWDVHVDEDVYYASHTARRWEIQRPDGSSTVSERSSFLIEGPRLYALHARSRDRDYGRRRRCLDAVTAAFDVMMYEDKSP